MEKPPGQENPTGGLFRGRMGLAPGDLGRVDRLRTDREDHVRVADRLSAAVIEAGKVHREAESAAGRAGRDRD